METPAPPAAWFFYGLALILAAVAFLVLLVALFGADWMVIQDVELLALLPGPFGVIWATTGLLAAGLLGAIGAFLHDVRRIVVNTSEEILAQHVANAVGRQRRAEPSRPSSPAVAYYYEQNGVEHGPVNHSRMAELLRSKRVDPFEKIERSVNGVREPFDPADFGF